MKNVLRFLVSFGIAFGIFYYLYDGDFGSTLDRLSNVDYGWVWLSLGLGMISHWFRAYRWRLLLGPTGHHPGQSQTIVALFLGYFANLILPRFGELTRCLALKKSADIPVPVSFGTVVTERLLDLLCLVVVISISLYFEYQRLQEFFGNLFENKLGKWHSIWGPLTWIFLGLVLLLMVLVWRYQDRLNQWSWWIKIKGIGADVWTGVISVFKVKQQAGLWASSIGIWVLYYLMTYVTFFAFEPTSDLNWQAGLSMLVMGGLAMSAPVQGGLGAYHYLVSALLIYYGITEEDGLAFAFLLHASQTLLMISLGLISMVVFWTNPAKPSTTGSS